MHRNPQRIDPSACLRARRAKTCRPSSTPEEKSARRARLTPEEDACWTRAFEYYRNGGLRPLEADRCAWRDVRIQHPRLRRFQGALP